MYANGWRHSFKCRRDLAINTATRNGFHFVGKLGGNAEPLYSVSDITTQQLLRSTLDGRSVAAVATFHLNLILSVKNPYHAQVRELVPRTSVPMRDWLLYIHLFAYLVNLFVYYICTIIRFFISCFGSSWNKNFSLLYYYTKISKLQLNCLTNNVSLSVLQ